jgi:hypothetical protein
MVATALRIAWGVSGCTAFALYLSADIFQKYDPAFPLRLTLLFALTLQIASVASTIAIGRLTHTGFSVFMPFKGGTQFVTMQAVGYGALAAALAGPTIYRVGVLPLLGPIHGPLAFCGLLCAVGDIMLMRSLPLFDASRPMPHRHAAAGEILLVILLALTQLVAALAAYLLPHLQWWSTVVITVLHIFSGCVTHLIIGWAKTANYRLFNPRYGSYRSQLVRAAAWFFWCAVILAGTGLSSQPKPVGFIVLPLSSIIANMGLLAQTLSARSKKQMRSANAVAKDGRFVLSFIAVLGTAFVAVAATMLDGPFGPGLSSICVLLSAVLFAVPPLTHFTGKLMYTNKYDLYHPFHHRGRKFLSFQACGWSAYTLAVLAAVLEWRAGYAIVTASCLLLSQFMIHSAIRSFDANEESIIDDDQSPSSPTVGATALDKKSTVARNELLVAAALSLLSLLLRVSCDVVPLRDPTFPTFNVLIVSTIIWAIAVPLAHLARSDRRKVLFRPFHGTPEYVALQAVGWCFYALCVTVAIVNCVEMYSHPAVVKKRSLAYQFPLALQGILMQLPFGLIAASTHFDVVTPRQKVTDVLAAVRALTPHDVRYLVALTAGQPKCKDNSPRLDIEAAVRALSAVAEIEHTRHVASEHRKARGVAGIIVGCLAFSCFLFALVADHVKSNSRTQSLVLSSLCMFTSFFTCASVHAFYGPHVHGANYKRWMPFRGGTSFVVWQMCAGTAFAGGVVLFVFSLSSLFAAAPSAAAHASGLIAAGALNAVAPVLALVSVYFFDASAAEAAAQSPRLFEHHAEGILSILIFAAAWTFTSAYDVAGAADDWALVAPPLLAGLLCAAVALPLGLVALRKSTKLWNPLAHALEDSDDIERSPTSATQQFPVVELIALVALVAIPAAGLLAAHFLYFRLSSGLELVVRCAGCLMGTAVVAVFTTCAMRTSLDELPAVVVESIITVIASCMYLGLFVHGVVMYLGMLIPTETAGYLVVVNTLTLMCPGPLRQAVNMVNVGYAGLQLAEGIMGQLDPTSSLINCVVALLCAAYHRTYMTDAAETGSRYSKKLIKWSRERWLWAVQRYFSLRIIVDSDERICASDADGGHQSILGFHPHGIFPLTAVWMLQVPDWECMVGTARRVVIHGASIIFQIPLVRDIAMGFGGCVVSKKAIEHTLKCGHSPLIVPGGQAEMIDNRFSHKELILTGHHRGFVRLAIRHRVRLVPVFVFGEHNIMDNVHWPRVQRFFLKRFGVGFPVWNWGRWCLPLPCKTPLTAIVCRSLDPYEIAPELATLDDSSKEYETAVVKVTKYYFDELVATVDRHKVEAGYPDFKVVVIHDRPY